MTYPYPSYKNKNYGSTYKERCSIAERLGDQSLRKWCVEQMGPRGAGVTIDYAKVDALFVYVKERKGWRVTNGQ